jgi:hypothetical protein
VPTLYGHGSQIRSTIGLLGERGLALLSWTTDEMPVADANQWSADARPLEFQVRGFGLEPGLSQRPTFA